MLAQSDQTPPPKPASGLNPAELAFLVEFQDALCPTSALEKNMPHILQLLCARPSIDAAALFLPSSPSEQLTLYEQYPHWLQGTDFPPEGARLAQSVLLSGKPASWRGSNPSSNGQGEAGTFLILPLPVEDHCIGLLLLASSDPPILSGEEAAFLEHFIVRRLGTAIYESRLFRWTEKRLEQYAVLNEIAHALTAPLDLNTLLQTLYYQIRRVIDTASYMVVLVDEATGDLLLEVLIDKGEWYPRQSFPTPTGLVGWVITHRRPLRLNETEREAASLGIQTFPVGSDELSQSWMGVPMLVGERLVGVLAVASYEKNAFSADDELLLTSIASQAAIAIEHSRLFQQVQRQFLELREAQEQLIAAARLATSTELAAGLGHEINNALTPILGISQLLLRRQDMPPAVHEDLEVVAESARRIRDIVTDFSQIIAEPAMDFSDQDVRHLVLNALEMFQWHYSQQGIAVEANFPEEPLTIRANAWQIRQALLNIFQNGMEAMPEGGKLAISAGREGRDIVLRIEDTGPGIAPEHLARLFEPGFTTKVEAGRARGLGLGLFVTYNIIRAHGGSIEVQSTPGEGTRFCIRLPASAPYLSTTNP